jgi:hypothetical protein
MTKHALAFLFLLTLTAFSADVVRLEKGAIVERLTLPAGIGAASVSAPGRLTADLIAAGWRDYAPATATGSVKATTWTDTGAQWVESVTYYSAAEVAQQAAQAAAAQAAAEANRLATPIRFEQAIQAPAVETKATDGHIYGFKVDPIDGDVFAVQRESERTSDAADLAATTNQLATRHTRRTRLERLADDIALIDTAVDAMMSIDLSATGTVGVAIAATTNPNKAALTAMRNALIDVRREAKVALNNARQAAEKIRKEIR